MPPRKQTTRTPTTSPFSTKGYQVAVCLSIKGDRTGSGARCFLVHAKTEKDGTEHYITIKENDTETLEGFNHWKIDFSTLKVDEQVKFLPGDYPLATVGWRKQGNGEVPFLSNVRRKEVIPPAPPEDKPVKAPESLDDWFPRITVAHFQKLTMDQLQQLKDGTGALYIGRFNSVYNLKKSDWHNPYNIETTAKQRQCSIQEARQIVIEQYRADLLRNPKLLARLNELRGKMLVCWCHPEKCHGDVLAELATLPDEEIAKLIEAAKNTTVKRAQINPDHWYYDISRRNHFYNELRPAFKEYGVPHKDRSRCIHTALGVKRLYETDSWPEQATKIVLEYLDQRYKKDDETMATTTAHWVKNDKDRKDFWVQANNWCNKHKITNKAGERKDIIHGLLNVDHMEEFEGTLDNAVTALKNGLEEMYPLENTPADDEPTSNADAPKSDDAVKQLWTVILPEFKTICPDVSDKNVACEWVLGVLGYKSMLEAYNALGTQGVQDLWNKNKNQLTDEKSTPPTTSSSGKPSKQSSSPDDKKAEIRERYNKPQRGNDYLMVQGRILLFRLDHPDWTIETEHVLLTEQTAVYKATIRNPEGRIIATGHGRATEGGSKHLSGRYIEKAETSAIGRALALAGFGTDDTLDDADYLADSPVSKAG